MRESFLSNLSPAEEACLKTVSRLLEQESARDKKLETIRWFLTEFRTDGKNWLEHGCIIFSQYYDTAAHVAGWLAAELGDEPVALYAGVGRSRLFLGHSSAAEEREPIKRAVKNREIRVVVATDAACEGLNLQTLGTLINSFLPCISCVFLFIFIPDQYNTFSPVSALSIYNSSQVLPSLSGRSDDTSHPLQNSW